MSLQLIGTNQSNSSLLAYDGSNQQFSLYSAFGSIDNPQTSQLPGFNGERQDPFTGASHLGNGYRAYNPILMRFNCPDSESPFGEGGINPYAYCENDPVNLSDPSGHGPLTRLLIRGFTRLFRHLLEEETSKALASVIVKTTRGALTYGTQVTKNIIDISARVEQNSNPQVAAKLQTASFAMGVINSITSLYSSINNIYNASRSALGNRGSISFEENYEISNRYANNISDVASSATDVVADATHTSSKYWGGVFEDIFNSIIGSEHRRARGDKLKSKTKIVYQLTNNVFAISSTVFAIASKAVEAKNPAAAEKLSLASSIFGYINFGFSFGGNFKEVTSDFMEIKKDLGTIGNYMENQARAYAVSSMSSSPIHIRRGIKDIKDIIVLPGNSTGSEA